MSGRPLIGLLVALVVEARHWTTLRWDFDDDACARAWQATIICTAAAAVLIWLDGSRYTALPALLSWLPVLLLPMQFVQAYGLRASLPLAMFSIIARRRRERSRRLGLIEETTEFDFGNVLFVSTLVAATVGTKSDAWLFLPGVLVLLGWKLGSASRARWWVIVAVLVISGFLANAGKTGLERLGDWIGRSAGSQRNQFDPNFSPSMIGAAGTVQLSPEILWRLRGGSAHSLPPLLRTASFNTFLGANWQNKRVSANEFKDLDTRLLGEDSYFLLLPAAAAPQVTALPYFTLRGAAAAETPLPLPGNAAALRDFELEGIERSPFGTVRVFPKESVIDGAVFWNGPTNPEAPPMPAEDLRVPLAEKEAIHAILQGLHLDQETSLRPKLALLRAWFQREFQYTRKLTIRYGPGRTPGTKPSPTAMTRFLTEVRAGHCEYFATAAALILREAGIPTRYATGYAVMERDPKRGEFIIRGTHGHAWCRVWDEASGSWIDFDATPPEWFAAAIPPHSIAQRLSDHLKLLREDFFLWRNQPGNRLIVSSVVLAIGLGLGGVTLRRLWRSKRRLTSAVAAAGFQGPGIRTPLHDLEAAAERHLGPRPPGQPFGDWLARLRSCGPMPSDLEEAIALHQRIRFDPAPAAPSQHQRLAALSARIRAALRRP